MENIETPAPTTKAERKQQRRAEKQAAREADARRGARRRQARWAAAFGGLAMIIGGAYWLASSGDPVADTQPGDATVLDVREGDWVRGASTANVTLVEYGDFQCPACAAYHPILRQLEAEFGDRMRIVFRHFPLEQAHPNARAAAMAAEAAGRQGKFWEMHDVLFERQTAWANEPEASAVFADYAAELGLNREQFVVDQDDPALSERVNLQRDSGLQLRVNSTPTFYLNGERLEFVRTYDDFKQRIVDALAGAA